MMNSETTLRSTRSASGWSIVWGILMLICGVLAIAMPLASSIGIVIVLGWLILFSAVWHLIYAFQAGSAGRVIWQILLALLYAFVAVYMLMHPLMGLLSLTLVLAVFLLIEGVLEIVLYFSLRQTPNAGWLLLNGILALILGGLIWFHWPSSSVAIVGTLVGISLIFSGISRIMLSAALRQLTAAMP